ncbi:MAG: hypothetical protein R3E66_04915 [bacterium]
MQTGRTRVLTAPSSRTRSHCALPSSRRTVHGVFDVSHSARTHHYKGILLRAEADAIPSVRAPLPVEQLISDTSTILCKQGESFTLNAAGLEDTTSADRSIVQVSPKDGAHQLRCFSPGKTTLTHAGQEFPILVGVSDEETHEALRNKGANGLEKCILNDLKDSFEQTVVARVAVEPDGRVSMVQRLDGTMPIETETCGLNVLKGLKLARSNKPRVVDFAWDGRLPKYFEKIVKYVSTSRYTQAKKLCAPLLENGVMATECMPLSKQFPSFIQDGCNLLGDSAKGIFNCNPK